MTSDAVFNTRFLRGEANDAYCYFGAHESVVDGEKGWRVRTWAPHAKAVSVCGDRNEWRVDADPMQPCGDGIWEVFLPHWEKYDTYKFAITTSEGHVLFKADPYAFHAETRPATASKLYGLPSHLWQDTAWCAQHRAVLTSPLNIYEVHLGSWRRNADGTFLDYRTAADKLSAYVTDLGYNCVELMPLTEYPLDASWGYQCSGYFAATSRYGTPEDLQYFVDRMHQSGIAVILDWVPSHFCRDDFALSLFDGACCYEYEDERKREHKSWGTYVFDYGRGEVKSFLLSSAAFWLKEFHFDGLRVDAVASMLYLDYDRKDGEWAPNINGGRENLEAIDFLRDLNRMAFCVNPNALMVAEESTAWPLVTYPGEVGGLGFNLKWNMGWMNDMCHYLKMDPWFRQDHHRDITFSMMYAFSENFVLPISHDEVVHMKGSLRGKMPGDEYEQLAAVRAFTAYLLAHSGKKLTFMGAELGQWHEWNFETELDWYLLKGDANQKIHRFFRDINHFYLKTKALWEIDFDWSGFEWLVSDDTHNNTVVFLRRDKAGKELVVAVNFSPNYCQQYRFGVPKKKAYRTVFSTDATIYGGSGTGKKRYVCEKIPSHGKEVSICIDLAPNSAVFLRGEEKKEGTH